MNNRTRLVLVAIAVVATTLPCPPVAATSADWHYLVVELDDGGVVEPVSHRRVALAAPRTSMSEVEAAAVHQLAAHGRELVDVEVIHDGRVAFRDVVAFERFTRVEAADSSGALARVDLPLDRAAAAVRVPHLEGATLILRAVAESRFELDHLDRLGADLPLADSVPTGSVSHRGTSGDPANRVDLLIMGDGYTTAQQGDFATDAADLETSFFSITPFNEYRNFVNVLTLFSASTESGADHPPYDSGCSYSDPSCCSDSTMLGDPLAGTFVATAFDGRFCANGIHRLLVVNSSKILTAAAAVPDWDQIFVLVNDTTYGGSGGSIAVASTHPSAPDVIRHEYGHSFTRLADEYESAYPGFPACSDITGPACEANVTDQTVRQSIKWEPWIEPTTPVPTPEDGSYSGALGLFEGARYLTTGMYRPRQFQCLMRSLGQPFCAVCAQAYVLTLYDGGWGVPVAGIDPIEPGSESPPPGTVQVGGSQTFMVDVLGPIGGPSPAIEWRVDGIVQNGQTDPSFTFAPPSAGSYTVKITVTDATTLVHPEMAGSSLISSRTWTAEVSDLLFADGFESGNLSQWTP